VLIDGRAQCAERGPTTGRRRRGRGDAHGTRWYAIVDRAHRAVWHVRDDSEEVSRSARLLGSTEALAVRYRRRVAGCSTAWLHRPVTRSSGVRWRWLMPREHGMRLDLVREHARGTARWSPRIFPTSAFRQRRPRCHSAQAALRIILPSVYRRDLEFSYRYYGAGRGVDRARAGFPGVECGRHSRRRSVQGYSPDTDWRNVGPRAPWRSAAGSAVDRDESRCDRPVTAWSVGRATARWWRPCATQPEPRRCRPESRIRRCTARPSSVPVPAVHWLSGTAWTLTSRVPTRSAARACWCLQVLPQPRICSPRPAHIGRDTWRAI